jgi:hypothetical protein
MTNEQTPTEPPANPPPPSPTKRKTRSITKAATQPAEPKEKQLTDYEKIKEKLRDQSLDIYCIKLGVIFLCITFCGVSCVLIYVAGQYIEHMPKACGEIYHYAIEHASNVAAQRINATMA